jgi:HKD family nuclease
VTKVSGNTLSARAVLTFRSTANVRIENIKNAVCALRVQVRCPSQLTQFTSKIMLQRILMETNWRKLKIHRVAMFHTRLNLLHLTTLSTAETIQSRVLDMILYVSILLHCIVQ